MRIDEYKRILKELGEDDLDKVVVRRSGDTLMLECPINPPPGWEKLQGALSRPPCPPQRVPQESPATQISGQDPLPTNAFLTGLMADLTAAFGEAIAGDCLRPDLLRGTQLTARQVMTIIGQAEAKEAMIRQQNDAAITNLFRDVVWVNYARNYLPAEADTFVRKLAAGMIRSSPEHARHPLSDDDVVSTVDAALAVYDVLVANIEDGIPEILGKVLSLIAAHAGNAGSDALARFWPEYAMAAWLSSNLDPAEEGILASALDAFDTNSACSQRFLGNMKSYIAELFIARTTRSFAPDAGVPDCRDNSVKIIDAQGAATEIVNQIIEQHVKQLLLVDRHSSLTDWQKIFVKSLLDGMPPDDRLFDAVINFDTSYVNSIIARRDYAEATRSLLLDILGVAGKFAEQDTVDSPFHGERLLVTLMSFFAESITPAEARLLVDALEEGDASGVKMIRQIVTRNSDEENAYDMLAAVLKERSGEAGPTFQLAFAEALGKGRLCSGALVEHRLDTLRNACQAMNRTDNKQIVDWQYLQSLNEDGQSRYLETALLNLLRPSSKRRTSADRITDAESLFVRKFLSLFYDIRDAFTFACQSSICRPAGGNDLTGIGKSEEAIFLPGGKPIMTVSHSEVAEISISLIDTSAGPILMSCQYTVPTLDAVSDMHGNLHRVNSQSSQLRFNADFTILSDQDFIEMDKPIRCEATLVFPKWPGSKGYPAPIGKDFGGKLRTIDRQSAEYLHLHADLIAYAKASENSEIITLLDALNAIREFRENRSRENAYGIYEKFLQSNALTFIGTDAVGETLERIYPKFAVDAIVQALLDLTEALVAKLDPIAIESNATISDFFELANRILNAKSHKNRSEFFILTKQVFFDLDLSITFSLVSPALGAALKAALEVFIAPPEPAMFDALEDAIIRYLDRTILPDFINYQIERSGD
ncbi:hypothetical protein [Propionivibrio dicarboxylicus]|uniref:Uncharacterized protein n=1 Tax=Propionivibrio dicarboxylicus TaxID=83767 RepID=A0A1G8KME3_9RHOO|nr:hypothetical protein [Propionivibrio dicarboxylicus]SDI44621.1 hypothetical protein SAMN05660652_03441 [Propionivibrio dicarboxylicus]